MPVPNAVVNISITDPTGGVTPSTLTTDENGTGIISVLLALEGNYTGEADYAGDGKYRPSTGRFTIVAKPVIVPTTLVLTPSAPSGYVGDTLTVALSLNPTEVAKKA